MDKITQHGGRRKNAGRKPSEETFHPLPFYAPDNIYKTIKAKAKAIPLSINVYLCQVGIKYIPQPGDNEKVIPADGPFTQRLVLRIPDEIYPLIKDKADSIGVPLSQYLIRAHLELASIENIKYEKPKVSKLKRRFDFRASDLDYVEIQNRVESLIKKKVVTSTNDYLLWLARKDIEATKKNN